MSSIGIAVAALFALLGAIISDPTVTHETLLEVTPTETASLSPSTFSTMLFTPLTPHNVENASMESNSTKDGGNGEDSYGMMDSFDTREYKDTEVIMKKAVRDGERCGQRIRAAIAIICNGPCESEDPKMDDKLIELSCTQKRHPTPEDLRDACCPSVVF